MLLWLKGPARYVWTPTAVFEQPRTHMMMLYLEVHVRVICVLSQETNWDEAATGAQLDQAQPQQATIDIEECAPHTPQKAVDTCVPPTPTSLADDNLESKTHAAACSQKTASNDSMHPAQAEDQISNGAEHVARQQLLNNSTRAMEHGTPMGEKQVTKGDRLQTKSTVDDKLSKTEHAELVVAKLLEVGKVLSEAARDALAPEDTARCFQGQHMHLASEHVLQLYTICFNTSTAFVPQKSVLASHGLTLTYHCSQTGKISSYMHCCCNNNDPILNVLTFRRQPSHWALLKNTACMQESCPQNPQQNMS